VLDDLTLSCNPVRSLAKRYREAPDDVEYLAAIAPVRTPAGCWAIVFSYPTADLLGADSAVPFWQRLELHRAALIYLGLAFVTLLVFLTIRRHVLICLEPRQFAAERQQTSFADQTGEAELITCRARPDGGTGTAPKARRRAEGNVDAFKTPTCGRPIAKSHALRPRRASEVRGGGRVEV
jgi:two-component system sensor histidine kinase ChvG